MGFKPYFRWSAPYTFLPPNNDFILGAVLNLILDGRLLIQMVRHRTFMVSTYSFKPCFRWSAPYTPIFQLYLN